MAAKRDLSRLVLITLTPTEAVHLAGYIEGFEQLRARHKQPPDPAMAELVGRIKLQLQTIIWPLDESTKAPYPV